MSLDQARKAELQNAISAARRYLISVQHEDGHWCGELEGDTILESEYLLTLFFLGRLEDPRFRKAAEYLRRQQLPEGGWAIYPGGPPEVSSSVKAYFALKLAGDAAEAPHMERARRTILQLGGIDACNSFTKIYLSIFGQYDWDKCPSVVPEIVLLPDWSPFSIYNMSSWSRAIFVPLSIIWAARPSCPIPSSAAIPELFSEVPRRRAPPKGARQRIWTLLFTAIDAGLKAVEGLGLTPLRRRAVRAAERWILERLEKSDGLGAIFPPIVNTIIAFRCLGYGLDDPRLRAQVEELRKLEIEEEETLRVQPCFSPVWDTAMALQGILESGACESDPAVLDSARWLLDREVREIGDWKRRNPEGRPGGWYFEYANEFYPDVDDTAEVLTALAKVRFPDPAEDKRRSGAVSRGLDWVLTMQNSDGGFPAFDKGCDNEILTFIPFADHNAMIDPSCEDITGRTLLALHHLSFRDDHPAVRKAADFLRRKQEPDGTWYGRWGCNYIYGTWLALRGLETSGERLSEPRYQAAAQWLCRHQNEDGGWGETPRSYDEPDRKGIGASTPSQTAWALMALVSLGHAGSESAARGIAYLLSTQQYDGSWTDDYWTGTGFPKVFYLRYHLYATYFPLWALSTCVREIGRGTGEQEAAAGIDPVADRIRHRDRKGDDR
jgi:squalene-hopene/tetraprenyl-beta-curcumene cyclase